MAALPLARRFSFGLSLAVALATVAALSSMPVRAAAAAPAAKVVADDPPTDPTQVKPLAVGTAAPAFTARNPDGSAYRFGAGARDRPAVLLFYRGGWCPFCNVHLGQLKDAEATLRARGYDVLFLSADRPEILLSSLKDDIEKDAAKYTLLSDGTAEVAKRFGVAFRIPSDTVSKYKSEYGIDLEAASGAKHHLLPVPAVFVVDRRGVIAFRHYNPDYRVRLSAEELLAAAP